MSIMADCLLKKSERFNISIPHQADVIKWIENELLQVPALLSLIEGLTFSTIGYNNTEKKVSIAVKYSNYSTSSLVFLVKDIFELITAVSLTLKFHMNDICFVVDNRNSFIENNDVSNKIKDCQEYVGEELQIHQRSSTTSSWRSFFQNRIIMYRMHSSYFDSSKDINDLSCILAEQAMMIRNNNYNNPKKMINAIMEWFRENIKYENTSQTSDHSAVGLYKNKTAVCQGIAAYAYQLLSYCGLPARYVSGEGHGADGWGSHGWNMVKIDRNWHHIDYTFELNGVSETVLIPSFLFKRNHRWSEGRYNDVISNEVYNSRKTLEHSVIILSPNRSRFSVNGCIIDTTFSHPICITINSIMCVSILDIISIYGGCSNLINSLLYIYIGTDIYKIPLNQLILKNNVWYVKITQLINIKVSLKTVDEFIILQKE